MLQRNYVGNGWNERGIEREGKYIRERVMMRIMREGRGKKDKLEFTHIVGVFGIPIAQHVVVIY